MTRRCINDSHQTVTGGNVRNNSLHLSMLGGFPEVYFFQKEKLTSGNLPSGKLSSGKLPFWETVLLGNSPSGKQSFWETFLLGNFPSGKVSFWETTFWETTFWELSFWETSYTGKNPLGNFRISIYQL